MVEGTDRGDRRLLAALEEGLSLVSRPYEDLARRCAMTEEEVLQRLGRLREMGTISRFGVVVRHRRLGYLANAMVVWDVEERQVRDAGERLSALPFVTLCYRRPRRPPLWPYNLFCMIHGRERAEVERQVEWAAEACGLRDVPRDLLFSRRAFKQRGARYGADPEQSGKEEAAA